MPVGSNPGTRRCPERSGGRREGRVGSQDVPLKPLEPLAGLDPQLFDHDLPGLPVRLQRLSRAVTAVQSEHQLPVQTLTQRELGHELGELADQFVLPAQVQFQRDPVLIGRGVLLIQAASCRPDELTVQARERGTSPEPQRIAIARHGLVKLTGIASRAGGSSQLSEPPGVKLPVTCLDGITLPPAGNDPGTAMGSEQTP
jgi:hypothetical protein